MAVGLTGGVCWSQKGKDNTMIPDIGLMVGAYIITRMTELLGSEANVITKVFAVFTLLLTAIALFDLMAGSPSIEPLP